MIWDFKKREGEGGGGGVGSDVDVADAVALAGVDEGVGGVRGEEAVVVDGDAVGELELLFGAGG